MCGVQITLKLPAQRPLFSWSQLGKWNRQPRLCWPHPQRVLDVLFSNQVTGMAPPLHTTPSATSGLKWNNLSKINGSHFPRPHFWGCCTWPLVLSQETLEVLRTVVVKSIPSLLFVKLNPAALSNESHEKVVCANTGSAVRALPPYFSSCIFLASPSASPS